METLPLSKLRSSDNNPRKSFDPVTIEGLSQSIKTDGLLQNLVVAKPENRKRTYTIISGERRYRALCLLVESGNLQKDVPVPVVIRRSLSEGNAHRIATIENIQREDLPPLEEAEAVTALLRDGMTLADVASQTGLSESTIKRRLALSGLCDEAKKALVAGEIGLAQAEALTLGSAVQQRALIEEGLDRVSPSQIKQWLTDEKANVAAAVFEKDGYSGTYTSDLFAADEATYFDDLEQFWHLQNKAIEDLAVKYKVEGFEPVEIMEGYGYQSWRYRPAQDDEKGGVVLQVHNSGHVEIHEGIVDLDLDRRTTEAVTDNPLAEQKTRPKYSRPLREHVALHKSMAVQQALLANPRIAKEVAVVQMIAGNGWRDSVSLNLHDCVNRFSVEEAQPTTFAAIEAEARILWKALGQSLDANASDICVRLIASRPNATALYEAVKKLSKPQLDRLHLLLTTLCFGQADCDELDTDENSLFNRVAADLNVDMRAHWAPDAAFLDRRSKDQLR
ncbi:MAG: ParB/RepB/Spo0J family partition protein [Alphaproteobacteria bacterium]|nr:ParB/RepB/Spo0J family partition protein [Alphaproteobacteria bacterium]